jgi:hypothetical protein
MARGHTPEAMEAIWERRARVIDLHFRGGTIRQIAEALNMPKSTVSDDIRETIRSRTWEETKFLQKAAQGRNYHNLQEAHRLFNLASRGSPATDTTPAIAPNHDRANRMMQTIIQIEERIARLEGTDAPSLSRVTVVTDEDIAAAIRERRERLRLVNPEHPLLHREPPALGTGTDT